MLIDIVWLILGLVALYFGAEWLVNSASKISLKFGISPLVVGLTVVAFGTSAPELFVSLKFNMTGNPDMALGNVIGSNICNIGMVLGISAFICTLNVRDSLLRRDMPVLLISSLLFAGLVWNETITRIEGVVLFAIVVAYTVYRLKVSHLDDADAKMIEEEIGGKDEAFLAPNWKLAFFVFLGLVVLYFGSAALERGGVSLAEKLGVPGALISLTVIAFSTSVPELATSIVASMKNEGDMIVGNIVGSCLFNLLCVMGFTAMISPINIGHIHKEDLYAMLTFTVILVAMMKTQRRISRIEGSTLLIGYFAYCIYLWVERIGHEGSDVF